MKTDLDLTTELQMMAPVPETAPKTIGATSFTLPSGRIITPGVPNGLQQKESDSLVKLYESIHVANGILQRYHAELLQPGIAVLQPEKGAVLTPLVASQLIPNLYYKREDLTSTRAYKVRGALVAMHQAMNGKEQARRFLTVSTGNHALGVLKAAELLQPESVRIAVPEGTAPIKVKRMQVAIDAMNAKGIKAQVVTVGKTFDEAKTWAKHQTAGEFYIDPYSNHWVVAGQGSIGLELTQQLLQVVEQRPDIEEVVLVAPVGGGGLLSGISTGLRMAAAWESALRNIRLTFIGVRLLDLNSPLGDAIRVEKIADTNRQHFSANGVQLMVMSDDHIQEGVEFVQLDIGILIEGASGGTLFPPLRYEHLFPTEKRAVISVLSGGNV